MHPKSGKVHPKSGKVHPKSDAIHRFNFLGSVASIIENEGLRPGCFFSTFATAQTPAKQPAIQHGVKSFGAYVPTPCWVGTRCRGRIGAPKALTVALSFCRWLGLGCPKQAFAKIANPRIDVQPFEVVLTGQGFVRS